MTTGYDKLKSGDFNSMNQWNDPDGVTRILLASSHFSEVYYMWIKDYGKPTEELVKEERVEP